MDRSLKQRLTGASVLIILGVIFIPMLLDGPPTDGYQEIDVPIPDPMDREFETRLLPVNQSAEERASTGTQTPRGTASAQDELGEVVETRLIPMNPQGSDLNADTDSVAETPDSTSSDTATQSASESAPVADSTPPPVRAQASPSPVTDAATDLAVVPGLDPDGGWMMQAGTFGSQANATGLAERLSGLGWDGTVTPISRSGSTLYQVAAGRFGSEQAADQAAARFASQFKDIQAVVRRLESADSAQSPSSADQTSSSAAPSPGLRSWMIQVASFGDEANAISLRDELRSSGYVAHVNHSGAGAPYRVRVGPLVNRSDAEATRDQIESAFDLKGIVVSHP